VGLGRIDLRLAMRPALYVAITSHGFGHATRTAAVLGALLHECPDLELHLATRSPEWLIASYLSGELHRRPLHLDVGVIQADSLQMDQAATLRAWEELARHEGDIIHQEAAFLRERQISLVFADIPGLATAVAQTAGVPCWMMGNFGWDFIYQPWGPAFEPWVHRLRDQYHRCDHLFRLPFHEPMRAFPQVEDVGLTGGDPQFALQELREQFRLKLPPERTVLLTFGGLGLEAIPYATLADFPDWQFLTFDRTAPALPNLIRIRDNRYRPVDFMPLCGRILAKPGYGTFAEACRLGIPIVSITRSGFAEAEVLLQGLQDYAHHAILPAEDFYTGHWEILRRPLNPPRQTLALARDGNQTIARALLEALHTQSLA
jgi:hypothetical protein